jgi:hypothetical protein
MPRTTAILGVFREGKAHMNKTNRPVDRIKMGLGIALLAALTGCVGYVDGGYGGTVVMPGPDMYYYGGYHERGPEVHAYSQRGYESRAVVHPVAARPARGPAPAHLTAASTAHSGGGGPQGKR